MNGFPLARRQSRLSGIVNPMFARYSGSEIKGGPAGCLSLSPVVTVPRAHRDGGRAPSGSLIVFKNKLRNPPHHPRPLSPLGRDIRARIH